jgi:uncharacterized LabA/DUF88 family protein
VGRLFNEEFMQRVAAYIDGYNLYYGLRQKKWHWANWLNLQAMVHNLLKPDQSLVSTKYFTTIIKSPLDRNRRQSTYLEALATLSEFHIFYGHFLSQEVVCHACGRSHTTYHEKMTDVNIAVQMMTDAFQDKMDLALLVSGDSDLLSPIDSIKSLFPSKQIIVAFPPARKSEALKRVSDGYIHISRVTLVQRIFPERVVKPNGVILRRPSNWT